MKKFMKKTVSWILTVAMVCPMIAQTLAFLPISFAEEGATTKPTDPNYALNGDFTDWDGWVLNSEWTSGGTEPRYIQKEGANNSELDYDEIEAAVDYFKKYNTSTTDGTLSNMQYNMSTMYDYDALDFNLAMRQAEFAAYMNGTVVGNYAQGNGFYFQSNDAGEPDDRDGKDTTVGAMQMDNFFSTVVEYGVADTTTDRVFIADGQYRLRNLRAEGKWIKADGSATGNAAEGVILTFEQQKDGCYTIQNQAGLYLSAQDRIGGTADLGWLGDDEVTDENAATTHFYIYRREDGYYVLEAGGDSVPANHWFLNYVNGGFVKAWGRGPGKETLADDAGNAFQLERVTEIPVGNSYQVILPDGTYTLKSIRANMYVTVDENRITKKEVKDENDKVITDEDGNVITEQFQTHLVDDVGVNYDNLGDTTCAFTFEQIGTTGTYYIRRKSDGRYLMLGSNAAIFVEEEPDATDDENFVGQFVVFKHYDDKDNNAPYYAIRSAEPINSNGKYCYLNDLYGLKDTNDKDVNDVFGGFFMDGAYNGITEDPGNRFKLQSTNAYNGAADGYAEQYMHLYGLNGTFLLRGVELEGPFVWVNDDKQVVKNGVAVEWTITEEPENQGVYTITTKIDGNDYYLTIDDDGNVVVSGTSSNNSKFAIYRAYVDANGDGVGDDTNRIVIKKPDGVTLHIGDTDKQTVKTEGTGLAYAIRNGWNAFTLYDLTLEDVSEFAFFANYAQFNKYLGSGQNAYKDIMEKDLVNGSPQLSSGIDYPVFGTEIVPGKTVYDNVQIPFIPVKSDYEEENENGEKDYHTYTTYVFDSNLYGARFSLEDDADYSKLIAYSNPQMILDRNIAGWFPFNDKPSVYQNQYEVDKNGDPVDNRADYHFGMSLSIPFTMTSNGHIGGIAEAPEIKFNFSGDDDVWVFIDGTLVLDLGGIHDKVDGEINFATNTWSLVDTRTDKIDYKNNKNVEAVPRYYNGDFDPNVATSDTQGYIFQKITDEGEDVEGEYIFDASLENFATGAHTLTIFYLERGESESNCRITYNLPQKDTLSITKQVNYDESGNALTAEEKAAIADEEFEFVLYMDNQTNGIAQKVTPASGLTYQIYENRTPIDRNVLTLGTDGKFTLKDGQSAVFTFEAGTVDKGATFQVKEIAKVGYSKTEYSYYGSTYNKYQIEGMATAVESNDPTQYVTVSGTKEINNPQYSIDPTSDKIYIEGVLDETEELDFVCRNYYGLSDTIVLDYGLGVDIDISQLPAWKDKNIALSDPVIQNYHDTNANGTPDVATRYGTVDNLTFELEYEENGVEWYGAVGLYNNKKVINNIGNSADSYVTVTFDSDKACDAQIAIYYGTIGARYTKVTVQETGDSEIVYCESNNITEWGLAGADPVYVTVHLQEGTNTIKLEGCDQYGVVADDQTPRHAPDLDKIVVDMSPNDAKFTYQLTEQMTAVDVLKYTVNANGTPVTGLIYIVPATVMYYEENFKDKDNNNWINYVNGDNNFTAWETVGSEDNNKQEAGIPGQAKNIYGRDDAYLNDVVGDSNGTSMHVNTNTGNKNSAQFSYSFTGTGTTFFGRMGDNTGFMQVVITDSNGAEVYRYYRDTQFVDNNGSDTDKDVADGQLGVPMDFDSEGKEYFYGIPLFTWDTSDSNLAYGTYTVTVTIAKPLTVDDIGNDALDRYVYGTEFWLDGIRVVNPLDMSPLTRAVEVMAVDEPVALADDEMTSRAIDNTAVFEAERVNVALGAYEADHETNPAITTVRDKILSDYEGATGSWQLKSGLIGVDSSPVKPKAFTDIKSELPGATEFKYYGPKEEVYLDSADKQSVTIYLPVGSLDLSKNQVHLGFKAPLANSGLEITVGDATDPKPYTVNNSTDCYYNITTLLTNDNKTGNYYKITIEATDGLVSLTNIKVTETNGYDFVATNGTDSVA